MTILSGKGGTGKTTVTASFFALADNALAADCDVDAPNLHLLLEHEVTDTRPFFGLEVARIDPDKCIQCGICEDSCAFGAITDFEVDPLSCEGCGVCELVCPEDAVIMENETTGNVHTSRTPYGPLVHALMNPGSEAAGKLVTETRNLAESLADEEGRDPVLVDGSPGIGCSVIASITGADLVLVVTEPTLPGLWGLQRITGVAEHFGIDSLVCINKSDVNPEIAGDIEDYARGRKYPIVGSIPFDEDVNEATMNGNVLVESSGGPAASAIREMWERVSHRLATGSGALS